MKTFTRACIDIKGGKVVVVGGKWGMEGVTIPPVNVMAGRVRGVYLYHMPAKPDQYLPHTAY